MIAGIAAVLLGVYAVAIVVALMSPGSDPQRGVAIGILMFELLFVAALGVALWIGWRFEKRWIVNTVFAVAACRRSARSGAAFTG